MVRGEVIEDGAGEVRGTSAELTKAMAYMIWIKLVDEGKGGRKKESTEGLTQQ